MKIFSFPYVVLDELMKEFTPFSLVNLSLCSKNAHAFVKTFTKTNPDLQISLSACDRFWYTLSISSDDDGMMITVTTQEKLLYPSDLKISSQGFKYRLDMGIESLYFCCDDVVQGFRETTNYICDLFKSPVSTVRIDREWFFWMLEFAQQRQEQSLKVIDVCGGSCIREEWYSTIMSCNATEYLRCLSSPTGNYRFDGNLPTAKHLYVRLGNWITREQLLGLESQKAELLFTALTSSDINALLKSWLAGGFPNLKYLKIEGRTLNDGIYEGIRDRL